MKGFQKIKDLIEGEISDYSYFTFVELEKNEDYKGEEFYTARIAVGHNEERQKFLSFKYNPEEDQIYIDMSEDAWREIDDYSTSIKYFWMALLEW